MWALFVESLFRSRRGTVPDLAKAIGVTKQTLYSIKRGDDQPRWATIVKMASYQGMEPEDLLTYVKSIG